MVDDGRVLHRHVPDLAVLSLHTSPLAQPGTGDSGGMNVYVRELVASLAQAGVGCDVYVRRSSDDLPEIVEILTFIREGGKRPLCLPNAE